MIRTILMALIAIALFLVVGHSIPETTGLSPAQYAKSESIGWSFCFGIVLAWFAHWRIMRDKR